MKAFTYDEYGPPQTLRMAGAGKPAPDAGEVLVNAGNIGQCSGADGYSMLVKPLFSATPGLPRPEQQILGAGIAGQVKAASSGVTRFAPGDEVYANLLDHGYGGFAEYSSARARYQVGSRCRIGR